MLRFVNLASGSTGNATLIEAQNGSQTTRLLVDCGLGPKELDRRLATVGLSMAHLDVIFITHEHADHIGQARAVMQKCGATLCMSHGTWLAGDASSWGLDPRRVRWAHDGAVQTMGALEIRPFTVPHDAREPLQLTCTDGVSQLGIVTDLGHVSEHVVQALQGCHALMLETNHDTDLLTQSNYPPFLKARISGRLGHLSNQAAAQLLAQVLNPNLHLVLAAHLSEKNNTPQRACAALNPVLAEGLGHGGAGAIELVVAKADQPSDWFVVG